MANPPDSAPAAGRRLTPFVALAVAAGLLLLPVAVWLDLRGLSERMLMLQARDTGRIIDDMRAFYASDVVGRVIEAGTGVTVTHVYRTTPGAIPIPATLSLELGRRISAQDGATKYRFASDLPFRGRAPHDLDPFERGALLAMRRHTVDSAIEISGSLFDRQVRIATAVVMGPVCVACHNTHPDSPKTDWKVGDVRGIQEVIVRQKLGGNIFAFKYLLAYFVLAAMTGGTVVALQRRQAGLMRAMNRDLASANGFLVAVSAKLAKYLPAQVHRDIFAGKTDAAVATQRRKLTILFSDLQDFTAITERMQPEDLTALLNEYLTEMAAIAQVHGGTVDKFIGDAIVVFFGDPETRGEQGDAVACLGMAIAMQRRLEHLNAAWRRRGIAEPLRARMGINTGYCNVGNFGSQDRLDYTIIGAEANLAARLQSCAEPGRIMLSFETYALVSHRVSAEAQPPIRVKGISRDIIPYVVGGWRDEAGGSPPVVDEHAAGIDLYLDLDRLDEGARARARAWLRKALDALDGD